MEEITHITERGLRLTVTLENGDDVRINFDPVQSLKLLRDLYGRRILLFVGACSGFDALTKTYPCPDCRAPVRLEPDGIRWRGYCGSCGYVFELDVAGELMTKLREPGKRGKR